MRRAPIRAAVLAAALAVPLAAWAHQHARVPIGPDLEALGWENVTFDGIPATSFTGTPAGVLEIKADRSSSVLYRPLDDVDLDGARVLEWQWQVVDGLPATDLTRRRGEDRPLAVYVWFHPKDGEVGMLARLGAAMTGLPPGRALTYVWGGNLPAGTVFANPHMPEKGRIVVLRETDAPLREWLTERVDLAADYERAFGEPAPKPAAVAVSGDSDDTEGVCLGLIRGLSFIRS